jgi:predicted SprT family Zn-dependent metalloprotease
MIEVFAAKKKRLETNTKMVAKVKKFLMGDEIFHELCKEYDQKPDILEGIPVVFTSDLDVTAKTINARVFLNSSLLDEKLEIIARYLLHELTHCFQHMEREGKKKVKKEKIYLNRPEELEAFQYQIKFDADKRSDKKVNEYVNDLLSYHKIPKDKRPKKKEELMEKMKK